MGWLIHTIHLGSISPWLALRAVWDLKTMSTTMGMYSNMETSLTSIERGPVALIHLPEVLPLVESPLLGRSLRDVRVGRVTHG